MYCVALGRRPEVLGKLKELGYSTIVIIDKSVAAPDAELCDFIHQVDDISDYESVSSVLQPYFNRFTVHAVIAPGEKSILTAAKIREEFGIPGRGVEISEKLRDKYCMKKSIAAKGIKTSEFTAVTNFNDGIVFLSKMLDQGKKAIVKPRIGAGTIEVKLLSDVEDWIRYFDHYLECRNKPHFREGMIMEEYILGEEYHVDSVIQDNQVIFSHAGKYPHNILGFEQHKFGGSIALSNQSDIFKVLKAFNKNVIESLKVEYGVTHMECFITKEYDIVFGEIAIRVAGSSIPENLLKQTKVDLFDAFVRVECFLPYIAETEYASNLFGFTHIPIYKEGRVKNLIKEEELTMIEGVYKVHYNIQTGDTVGMGKLSHDKLGDVFIYGKDLEAVYQTILQIHSMTLVQIDPAI
ncbi:ATP-grasp domain-containing protein [Paenibacillus rhizophilus]|uniref:ATP-grasp domain-containing protein n=1 Tax=Paenibacillus rhizophilus TaxID=1850366 RepID=A0A3N9PD47_9BACL|nr:ATP-grasp domain-containing protein [Paenibacillus rhizophilus]RQW13430.1 ATP-grasp domain-containing protein [Paenibacillus rhizophilus]